MTTFHRSCQSSEHRGWPHWRGSGSWSLLACGRHTSVFSVCWLSFGSLCCHVIATSAVVGCVLWVILVNPGPRGLEDLGTSQLPLDWLLLPSSRSSVSRPQKHLPSHPLSHCCPVSCDTGFVFVSDSLACLSCCLSNVLICSVRCKDPVFSHCYSPAPSVVPRMW